MKKVLKWGYGVCTVIAFTLFFFIDNAGYRSICIWIGIIAGFGLVDLFLFKKLQKGNNAVSRKQNILFLSCVLAIGVVLVILGQIDSIEQREAAIILIAFFGVISILSAIGTVKLIRQHRNNHLTTSTLKKRKEMDYYSYSKPKFWANIVCGIICYAMFANGISRSIKLQSDYLTPFLFLFLAVNCTFRIFRWIKLNRKKGSLDENAYSREEFRNGIIIRIFSEATALIIFLVWTIIGIIGSWDTIITIIMVASAICFGIVLVQDILNLKRFDRKS